MSRMDELNREWTVKGKDKAWLEEQIGILKSLDRPGAVLPIQDVMDIQSKIKLCEQRLYRIKTGVIRQ